MENEKTVYCVTRRQATKSIDIGDFDTPEQARHAMFDHYHVTPKRGTFYYSIMEMKTGTSAGGFRYHSITISGKDRQFYERWTADRLRAASVIA